MDAALSRRGFLAGAAVLAAGCAAPAGPPAPATDCDVFVYGSTPGGVAAAVEAARRGCRVVLACPKAHAGGMAASGLSTTDAVRRDLFGGLVQEFVGLIREEYRRTIGEGSPDWKLTENGWYYEPSVAERAFDKLIEGERG